MEKTKCNDCDWTGDEADLKTVYRKNKTEEMVCPNCESHNLEDVPTEKNYYFADNGKVMCNFSKKECIINDTATGSSCPICKENPNKDNSIIIKTEKS